MKVKGGKGFIKNLSGHYIPRIIYEGGCCVDRHGVEFCSWLHNGHPWCVYGCEEIEEE